METIIRNVRDLGASDRSALERIIGHELRETQQLVVNVVNLNTEPEMPEPGHAEAAIPDWWRIYEGLDEEEVDNLDAAIRERANLTRRFGETDGNPA